MLWYPVAAKNNKLCQAPDVIVVFGIPKGYRGSYQQWNEDNIAPQIALEIGSPGNRLTPIIERFRFYERYGVEEYYLYHPHTLKLTGGLRVESQLEAIKQMDGWVSPRLGVWFQLSEIKLEMFRPKPRNVYEFCGTRSTDPASRGAGPTGRNATGTRTIAIASFGIKTPKNGHRS